MKYLLITATLAALVTGAACDVAVAQAQQGTQSSNDAGTGSQRKTMEQCMAQQKATNSGLTEMQMHTTCKNEMKGNKMRTDGNDLATGPQADGRPPQQ